MIATYKVALKDELGSFHFLLSYKKVGFGVLISFVFSDPRPFPNRIICICLL